MDWQNVEGKFFTKPDPNPEHPGGYLLIISVMGVEVAIRSDFTFSQVLSMIDDTVTARNENIILDPAIKIPDDISGISE